jgi:hypothetical protein
MHILYKIYLDFENKHKFIIELISPQQPIYGILYFYLHIFYTKKIPSVPKENFQVFSCPPIRFEKLALP